jgi:hypothetical protein
MGVDPNQSTTKPRQMPSGSDSGGGIGNNLNSNDAGGLAEDQQMDPAMNGADMGAQAPGAAPPGPPSNEQMKAARRISAVLAMMRTARLENPALTQPQAYDLAKEALKRFPFDQPLVVEGVGENALNFGNRGRVQDGPLMKAVVNWADEYGRRKEQPYAPKHTQGRPDLSDLLQTVVRPKPPPDEGGGILAKPPASPTGGAPGGANPEPADVSQAFTFQDAADDVDKERELQGMVPRSRQEQPVPLDYATTMPVQPSVVPAEVSRGERVRRSVERGMNLAQTVAPAVKAVAPVVKEMLGSPPPEQPSAETLKHRQEYGDWAKRMIEEGNNERQHKQSPPTTARRRE